MVNGGIPRVLYHFPFSLPRHEIVSRLRHTQRDVLSLSGVYLEAFCFATYFGRLRAQVLRYPSPLYPAGFPRCSRLNLGEIYRTMFLLLVVVRGSS